MASIKVKFRPSTIDNHEGTIYYQIIHERKTRHITSYYHIYASEWDTKRSILVANSNSERRSTILSIRDHIRSDVERLAKIIRRFDSNGLAYTATDVINEFHRQAEECSLLKFMEGIIVKLKQNGKIRTSETYATTLNNFKKFLASQASCDNSSLNDDIMLDRLDSEVMESYEAWQRHRGITQNTISFYNRIIRATYNRAVENEIIDDRHPFRHVYTGIDKTIKRSLPLATIKRLKALDLSMAPTLDYARDIFVMSFMLRGMSFIDMAYLRKSDLKNGHIIYRRHKTGQQLTIEWTKEMQSILDKYPQNTSGYLLPIIKKPSLNERSVYRNAGYNINHSLKKVAKCAGITIPLTLYVARHSWASAAKAKGIPMSVISEGMGHDSETTTQIYLASLDTSVVDKANSLIIRCIS